MHIIIPHFTMYSLISQKNSDFILWSKVVEMLANKNNLNQAGFLSILSYYASINRGVSPKVQSFHPNIIAQPKPVLNLPINLDPYWVSGFEWRSKLKADKIKSYSFNSIVYGRNSIKTTKNLLILNDNNKCLDLVVWGSYLSSTAGVKFSRQQLSMVQLPPFIKEIMVGLTLSDAWLSFSNERSKNARLGFQQSLAHFGYFWFVYIHLSHYCFSYPALNHRTRLGNSTYELVLHSRSMPCITELYDKFYVNKEKIIPNDIYNLLTPVALAHLILGDGSFQKHGLVICTDSYSIQYVVRLMNVLILPYELECRLRNHTSTITRIYIRQKSMSKLKWIVEQDMHISMMYKIGN